MARRSDEGMLPSGIKTVEQVGKCERARRYLPSPSARAAMGCLHGFALLVLYSAATAAGSEEGKNWCYASQQCQVPDCKEPRLWAKLFPECGNRKQSPVNILTRQVKYDNSLKPFNFKNYNIKSDGKWIVKNNGHTVQVQLDETRMLELGGLTGRYKAMQFHFHWGSEEGETLSPGSEHSIDGVRYAMELIHQRFKEAKWKGNKNLDWCIMRSLKELHIVHIKEEFKDIASAIQGKGVAVLGFFITVGQKNGNYEPLISKLKDIGAAGEETEIPALVLESLIPEKKDLTSFYRYTGSLTTPGCNEEVVWTLFEKPIELELNQIREFWKRLHFDSNMTHIMVDNFRPIQPLDSRIVYKSSSNALLPPRNVLLLVPAAAYLACALIQ